jgi:hypothetical protein
LIAVVSIVQYLHYLRSSPSACGYSEQLAEQAGAPALIFDWRVEAIEMDAAPWVETEPRYFERDRRKQSWKSLRHTNAWKDDNMRADYVLSCSRLPGEPRREP